MRSSIRGRLTRLNMLVLALVLVAMATALRYTVEINLKASLDRDMAATARLALQRWYGISPRQREFLVDAVRLRGGGFVNNSLADLFAAGSLSGARSGMPPLYRPRLLTADRRNYITLKRLQPWDEASYTTSLHGKDAYATTMIGHDFVRVYSCPIKLGRRVDGVVQIAESLSGIRHTVNVLTRTLFALIPIALIAVGVGSAFLSDRALKPVGRMAKVAGEISAKDLSRRLDVAGNDEFSELAKTFNSMLARLEESFADLEQAYQRQQQFTGDASHELRTPLTVIKANTSLALTGERTPDEYREALAAADTAATSMNAIVQDLLFLARADSGRLKRTFEPVNVKELFEDAVNSLPADQVPITIDAAPSLTITGDRASLLRLITNLLTNAIRHTPHTGSITIAASANADCVTLSVADTGEGIEPRHIPHLTERFYRCESSRSRSDGGAGLGLSICQSIVDTHSGTLTIESSLGNGTTVTVKLPGR